MLTETEGPPAETSIHLRRGKWSVEEENYANKIISLFNQGKLSILPGTTLRSFLSEKLQCDPMRITKKYAGKSCIGKQIYQPCDGFQESIDSIREAEKELEMFEKIFLNKIQAKAAASAALQSPLHSARTPSQRLLLKQVGSSEDLSRKNVSDAMDVEEDKEQESSSDHNDANSNDSSEENETNLKENDRFLTASSLPVPKTIFASLDRPMRSTSTKKHSFYRRNMSAPNLSSLPISKIGLSSENSNTNYEEANDKVQVKRVTDEFLLMGGRIPFYSKGESPYLSTAPSSITAKKRSHSVMALMDFEKLVSDDKAAGDLFYEFITMVSDINSSNKRQHRQVSTKDSLPFRDDTNLLQSKRRSGVKVGAKLTVNIEEEESSNHSRETVVHKYEQKDGHFNSELESHLVVMETDARHKHSDVAGEESVMVVHQQLTSHILQDDSTDDCDNFF